MTADEMERLLESAAVGRRLQPAAIGRLIRERAPAWPQALGRAADRVRQMRHGRVATFINNLQINPSNVCVRDCGFCGFAVLPGREGGYSLDEATILEQVAEAAPVEVHIVGGLNHEWGFTRSLGLVRLLRERFPRLHIKCFTAVEIHWFATLERRPVEAILEALRHAGMDAMPGGGAELFSERIRRRHFPRKLGADDWLAVHEAAHRLGIPSNATMLFGLGESWGERLDHLLRLRELQDRSGGFDAFIPLALQPGRQGGGAVPPLESLAVVALSRLVLDNVPHIKAYWPMLGTGTAAVALSWGADDLDGTLGLERVAYAAGSASPRQLARREMVRLIREAGFEPRERDGRYRPLAPAAAA